ncbi:MAG: Gfo/Idh/MocA family oxidoreductase [Ruminococcus sp.]|nr:Gfo/Idh/MocA family oxidoreductase [Ruminococcus sp.]
MLNFGIMGAGGISRAFCGALRETDGAQTVAVAAQDLKRAEKFAKEQGIPKAYGSYAQMLADKSVDIVYIGNTTNLHYECIKMCLAAGKHVLCEKAMVETEERALECFDLAAKRGLFLMEAMWSRFLPKSLKVREWIKKGRIGEIVAMQATIGNNIEKDPGNRFYSPDLGGGAMYDLGVYPIDLLTWYSGLTITSYTAKVIWSSTGIDETVSLNLDLEGVPANAMITFNAPMPEDIYIYGEKGVIRVPRAHWGGDAMLLDPSMKEIDRFSQPEKYGMKFEAAEVVRCIEDGKLTSAVASPEMTVAACRMYDKILRV